MKNNIKTLKQLRDTIQNNLDFFSIDLRNVNMIPADIEKLSKNQSHLNHQNHLDQQHLLIQQVQ